MDSRRFDALSRALARRQRARLLSLGTPAASAPIARAQETEPGLGADGICRMEFEATVRVRTSLFSSAPEVTRGMLELDIGDNGGITGESRLVLEDGESAPVVGQGPGQSIALRISLGEQTIVAVGVGEQRTSDCAGIYSGRTIGPLDGDLGDWTATAGDAVAPNAASTPSGPSNQPGSGSSGGSGGSSGGSGGSSGGTTPTTTPCTLTQNDCSDLLLDLDQCACICQNTGEPICGERCCTGGSECVDGTTCVCPGGATYCEGHCLGCPAGATCQDERCVCPAQSFYCDSNNSCVPCQEGRTYDPNDCSCTSSCLGEIGAVCNGVCVDLADNPANCGACGVACANGQTCVSGACQCASGWTLCGDTCRNLLQDRQHCGECFFQCGAFDSCIQGTCG